MRIETLLNLLTTNDILIALLLGAVLTWAVNRAAELVTVLRAPDLERILKKCYDMFPTEILHFRGEIYKRGMNIRMVTTQNKTFEGKFLGLNSDNMICLMTKGFIIAQALKNIEQMELLDLQEE
ncbi:MAG: hypothetical protein FWE24_05480 [Defluviitaleaceae bacterium]|nr:hypothetical protein [Defluviitaleaceae bacterium]